MESLYSILCIFFLTLSIKFLLHSRKQRKNLPPSPLALPIIGHLHLLKQPIHQSLHNLSEKYGPIFSLRLGSRFVVVVTSPSAVEECFTKNDIVLANRAEFLVSKYLFYNSTSLATANYGDHWRNLRRISAIEIFSTTRLNSFVGIRKDEVKILLRRLYHVSSRGFARVELRSMLSDFTLNIIMRMVAGKRYYGEDMNGNEEAMQFRKIMQEFFECSGMTNPADLFPILQWVDYDGFVKRLVRLSEKMDSFLQELIDEQRHDKNSDTMITHFLNLQESQPEYYNDEIIKGFILVMLVAGTETSTTSMEWAIANLVNHPEVLKKAKAELDAQVGQDHSIDEAKFPKLRYLRNIILENLRLYPVGPLLVPHMSSNDCRIGEYHVPPQTMLIVNAWAIQRDPKSWDDPTSFKPERFENMGGETYKLMPFGLGRRACPGESLAIRTMTLALSSLIQCFEWESVGGKKIDMAEKMVITMSKAQPLEVMCKARPNLNRILF